MLLPIVLVRILKPEQIGIYKIFFLYLMIAPAFSLTSGLVNGLYYWAGNEKAQKSAYQISAWNIIGLSLLFSLVLFLFRNQLSFALGLNETQIGLFCFAIKWGGW